MAGLWCPMVCIMGVVDLSITDIERRSTLERHQFKEKNNHILVVPNNHGTWCLFAIPTHLQRNGAALIIPLRGPIA